jgi:8-oxo-dGTP pyrophosphatase MutT (NUDIX family)
MMGPKASDPRLLQPQCAQLTPVQAVHTNPLFTVFKRGEFYSVEYNQPQVAILPILGDFGVVMVRQERPLIADLTLELPAGGVKCRESAVDAAIRELLEETGIEVSDTTRFQQLQPLCVTPRYPCLTHIFKVNLTRDEFDLRKNHDGEIKSVECVAFDTLPYRIISGEIYLSLPIAILAKHVLLNR